MVNLLNTAYWYEKVLMGDDLAALTTRTRLPPRCIGSHFDVRAP